LLPRPDELPDRLPPDVLELDRALFDRVDDELRVEPLVRFAVDAALFLVVVDPLRRALVERPDVRFCRCGRSVSPGPSL
jgi:hypothetical protein